mgnify:FL=1|tara:strand:+ start:78 stop:365 length:288 start_codon:yes stop_codon:yes gene_type:complete
MKIYRLYNVENDECYIGQTTQQHLWTRKGQHKYSAINDVKPCSSKKLYNNCNNVKNIKIEELEELSTNSKMLGEIRERFWINYYNDKCVNQKLRD